MTKQQKKKCPLWPTSFASKQTAVGLDATDGLVSSKRGFAWMQSDDCLEAKRHELGCKSPVAWKQTLSPMAGLAATDGADEKSFRKSAHIGKVDVNACSSFNPNTENEMSTETYKTIDKLVRKWSYLFNLDDHHAGKLRKSLEKRAECLERKYDPNQCGNYEGYIASCLAKFAGYDASRAKDQQSARGEVSLDEPVNAEETDAATRLDFVANDERVVAAKRRAKDVWEAVALLPPAYRRICEWIMDGWSDGRIAFQLGMHRTTFKRFVFPKVRVAFIALYGERR